jgi:hypothetical protein
MSHGINVTPWPSMSRELTLQECKPFLRREPDLAMMEKVLVSITKEMKYRLETERKRRLLDSIPETIRTILSEHLSQPERTAGSIGEDERTEPYMERLLRKNVRNEF